MPNRDFNRYLDTLSDDDIDRIFCENTDIDTKLDKVFEVWERDTQAMLDHLADEKMRLKGE